eukprot:2365350-Pleurochrysis_carterae.AAC.2
MRLFFSRNSASTLSGSSITSRTSRSDLVTADAAEAKPTEARAWRKQDRPIHAAGEQGRFWAGVGTASTTLDGAKVTAREAVCARCVNSLGRKGGGIVSEQSSIEQAPGAAVSFLPLGRLCEPLLPAVFVLSLLRLARHT